MSNDETASVYEPGAALAVAKFAMWLADRVTETENETEQVLVLESPAVGVLSLLATALMALEVFAQKGNEAAQQDVLRAIEYAKHSFGGIGEGLFQREDSPYEKALEYIDVAKKFGFDISFIFGDDDEIEVFGEPVDPQIAEVVAEEVVDNGDDDAA